MKAPKQYRPLEPMLAIAHRIVYELLPFCDKIEIAGSIRRKCPHVGDIDLVALPMPGMRQMLIDRMLRNTRQLSAGAVNISVELANGIPVQLFIAHGEEPGELFEEALRPSNWISLLVMRTGSRLHNIVIANIARSKGMHWNPQEGLQRNGRYLQGIDTEEAFFAALDLPYVAPEDRQ